MPLEQKIRLFILVTLCAFLVLVARLYYLQIIQGQYFLERSQSNFVQERVIKHNRGKIIDKNGKVLVDNRLSYDVFVTFSLLPDSMKSLRLLSSALKIKPKDLREIDKELLLWNRNSIDEDIVLVNKLARSSCDKVKEIARLEFISGITVSYANTYDKFCQVKINSQSFPSQKQSLERLKNLLNKGENLGDLWSKAHKKAQGLGTFKPTLLIEDVGFDVYARIENAISLGLLSGISVTPSQRRRYMHGDFATHLIGFLNQISLNELQQNSGKYRSGDYIGRKGIEATYEEYLRGQDGIEKVVVDAKGRRFSESWENDLLGHERIIESKPGANLKLTIDYDLQKSAQEFFLGESGSVVVMDINTGFILALASFPTFDPNKIISADNSEFFKVLLTDKKRPFKNKAVQDHYSPGSIFKVVTAVSGLNKKLISTSYHHNCSGTYKIHKTQWRCFLRTGHGPIALADSLKKSCDGYYYELGHRLGLENLANTSLKLGFGQKTGIDLLGEVTGIVPTKQYYLKRFGYVAPGFVVNMSIGQGDLAVTPIQAAVAYAALANGGKVYKPQIVSEIQDSNGKIIKLFDKELKESITEGVEDFDEILEGLSYVTEPGGSAYGIRYNPKFADIADWIKQNKIQIVGKTGTAQVVALSKQVDHVNAEDVVYEHRDHAWFAGLYPKEKPQIVVIVMTEHAGFGSSYSAPVAIRLMKKWQEQQLGEIK